MGQFKGISQFAPMGDQPQVIERITEASCMERGRRHRCDN